MTLRSPGTARSRQHRSHVPTPRSRRLGFNLFRCFSTSVIDELPPPFRRDESPTTSPSPPAATNEGSARTSHCNKHDLRAAEDPLPAPSNAEVNQALQEVRHSIVACPQREGLDTPDRRSSAEIPFSPGLSPDRAANLSPIDRTILEGAPHARSPSPQESETDEHRRDSEWLSSDDRSSPVSTRLIDVLISSEYSVAESVRPEPRTPALTSEISSGPSSTGSTRGGDGGYSPPTPFVTQNCNVHDDKFRQIPPDDDLLMPPTPPMPSAPLAPLPCISADKLRRPAHLPVEATTSSTRLSSPTLLPTPEAEQQHVGLPATAVNTIEAHFAREPLSRSIGRAALVALFLPPHADTQITQGAEPAPSGSPFSVVSGSTNAFIMPWDTSRASPSMQDETPALSPVTDYGSTMMTTAPTLDTIDIPTPEMDMPERMTWPHLRLDETMAADYPDTGKAWTRRYEAIRPGPSVRFSWANGD